MLINRSYTNIYSILTIIVLVIIIPAINEVYVV
ncbi:MAG: hypothetical protein RL172_632 [Bacteroidota bacterium]|jgi:hypothetical protein